jgi:hypothetical protein
MNRPKWLELGPQEMAELRALPVVQMIVEWLEWERNEAREWVVTEVANNGDGKVRAGAAFAFTHILKSLNTVPSAIADMDDEEFTDPAERPSRRKEPDAEVQ